MIHLICPNPAVDRTLLLHSIKTALPNRPIEVKEFPGGKSFNVAYALSYEKSPVEITIHTMLGGLYGTHVANLAQERGYHVAKTHVEQNTRLCNILVDMSQKTVIPVYENGFDLTEETLAKFTETLLTSIQTDDLLVFSGSLMKGMPADYICQIDKELQKRNLDIRLCVDTSGETLAQTYQQTNPYLIKINDEELQDIFPEKELTTVEDYLEVLKNDIRSEIPNFIVTLGKKGIAGRINGAFYRGYAEPVEAKNPIACGDFFLGRLVKGILQEETPETMLQSALLFSTCNVMNWYPEVTDAQLESLVPTITVEKI